MSSSHATDARVTEIDDRGEFHVWNGNTTPVEKDDDHVITDYPSAGPQAVAFVFKVAAFLVLVGGLLSALSTGINLSNSSSLSTTNIIDISVGIAAAAILFSATLGFFGYVLELLLDIRWNLEFATEILMTNDEPEENFESTIPE